MNLFKTINAVLVFSLMFTGCIQDPKVQPAIEEKPILLGGDPPELESEANLKLTSALRVTYASASPRQHFDFYTSDTATASRPFLLLVHGGGWVFGPTASTYQSYFKPGSDQPYKNFVLNLVNAGFSVGIMKYRHPKYNKKTSTVPNIAYNQSPLADIMSDINDAVNTAIAQAPALKIDANKIGIIGESAGAHLALMYAYGSLNQNKVKNVISLYGPTDVSKEDVFMNYYTYPSSGKNPKLLKVTSNTTTQWGASGSQDEDTNLFSLSIYAHRAFDCLTGSYFATQAAPDRRAFSPIALINSANRATLPQTLALHGTGDVVVNPNQLDLLREALGASEYTSSLLSSPATARHLTLKISGFGHGWVSTTSLFGLSSQFDSKVSPKIIDWLNARLK